MAAIFVTVRNERQEVNKRYTSYNNFALHHVTYLGDEVFGVGADLDAVLGGLGPADRRVLDQVVHLVLVGVVKGRDANDHLVDQDA